MVEDVLGTAARRGAGGDPVPRGEAGDLGVSLRTLLPFDLAGLARNLWRSAGPAVTDQCDVPMWW
jgi:hypothetical protein